MGASAVCNGNGTKISDPIIIDIRHRLPLKQRLVSDLSTASLWAGWLWQCRPVMVLIERLRHPDLLHRVSHLFAAGLAMSLEHGMLAVFIVAAALWAWSQLSEWRTPRPQSSARPDYARHFGLAETQLRHYRDSRTCIVHHDERGDIIGIDAAPAPEALPAPTALVMPILPADIPRHPEIAQAA